jgi:uncharacterized repeat protein (TIGR03803 family)
LILLGDTLYATAQFGGSTGHGTVFALNTDGTSFTNLHDFAGYPGDGTTPASGLILLANKLYGTAPYGGSSSNGTVFGLLTDGTGFTNLHHCTTFALNYTNSDGANPLAGSVILRNNLYGTASQGGRAGNGTVFSLALAPPTLNISVSGPYTTLKWPANDPAIFASGFHVQTTTDPLPLSPATIWVNLPAVPSIMNGEFTVILANSYAAQRVYRLWQ